MKVDSGVPTNLYSGQSQLGSAPKSRLPLVVGALAFLLIGFFLGSRYDDWLVGTRQLDYSGLDEIYTTLVQSFDGEIDTAALIDGAKRGMVAGLGDAYTQYFSYDESREFRDQIEGNFEGIGAELTNRDGKLTIQSVLPDTPAQKSGLLAGDIILKVDEEETISWSAESAVQIIRGPSGTNVKLIIIRGNEQLEFNITRAKITNPSVRYEIKDSIGYLDITRFGSTDTVSLAKDAAHAFVDAGVRGVVLDLRGNAGGYVDSAAEVASLWLEKGDVVVIEKVGDLVTATEKAKGNNTLHGIPTVVLIDGNSASASEIVAGALSDHGAAQLVGTKSFGKGSVQEIKPLRSGSQLKVTIARWFTPNGKNIDKEGIAPDIEVKFDAEMYKNGIDNQKQKAIEVLSSKF